jgi:hypothetical protein
MEALRQIGVSQFSDLRFPAHIGECNAAIKLVPSEALRTYQLSSQGMLPSCIQDVSLGFVVSVKSFRAVSFERLASTYSRGLTTVVYQRFVPICVAHYQFRRYFLVLRTMSPRHVSPAQAHIHGQSSSIPLQLHESTLRFEPLLNE